MTVSPNAAHALFAACNSVPIPLFFSQNDRLCSVNREMELLTGYSGDELQHRKYWEIFHPDFHERLRSSAAPSMERCASTLFPLECRLITRSGEERWVSLTLTSFTDDGHDVILGTAIDITAAEHAREELWKTNELLEKIFSSEQILIAYLDPEFNFLRVNRAYAGADGKSPEFYVGKNHFDLFPDEENKALFTRVVHTGEPCTVAARPFTYPGHPERGITYWDWTLAPLKDPSGGVTALALNLTDVTKRIRAEQEVYKSNKSLRTLSIVNQALIRATSEQQLLNDICTIIVDQGGYRLAWIGYAQDDAAKSVRPVAQSGFDDDYLHTIIIHWGEDEYSQGPTGRAIRTGAPAIVQNIFEESAYAPWKADAAQRSFSSSIALPLRIDSRVTGALNIYSAAPDAFNPDEVALLAELCADLGYGIESLRVREARKKADEAVRTSEMQYRELFTNVPVGIYQSTPAGIFTDANPALIQILAFPDKETFLTSDPRTLYVDPEDRDRWRPIVMQESGTIQNFVLQVRRYDGKTIWVRHSARALYDEHNHVSSIEGAVLDITESKKAEQAIRMERQRFNDVLETLPAYLILLTPDYRVPFANAFFRERFGDSHGKRCYEYLFNRESPCEVCETFTVLKTMRPHEWEWVGPDGCTYSIYDFPFTDTDGSTLILEMGIDITERKKVEEEIRSLNTELEERVAQRTLELEAINSELEAFAYSVSHDLRAPLRSMDGFSLELLEDFSGELGDDAKALLDRIRNGAQRMAQLIDDLLNLSRVTRSEFHLEQVNLSSIAAEIARELQRSHANRQVEFLLAPGIHGVGDCRLLGIALENLLGNAWKFTSKHPTARIEFGTTTRDGTPVYFVRDDGAGFKMAYVKKLFGAFQRLHAVEEFDGTGIGLATVQRIIHRHGGRIWAEGEIEQGATFYFTLAEGKEP